ncbi:MAG: YhgE/Pip family protein, partial [Weissella cibaria]
SGEEVVAGIQQHIGVLQDDSAKIQAAQTADKDAMNANLQKAFDDTQMSQEQREAVTKAVQNTQNNSQVAELMANMMDEYQALASDVAPIQQMVDDNKQLVDAAVSNDNALSDAKDQLSQLATLPEAVQQLDAGAQTLNNKLPTLTSGIGQLTDGANTLDSKSTSLNNGTSELASKSDDLVDGIAQLTDGANALNSNSATLNNGTSELLAKSGALVNGITQLTDGANTLDGKSAELNNGTSQLQAKSGTLVNGINKLTDGVNTLDSKSAELNDGTSQLQATSGELVNGIGQLVAGANTLDSKSAELNNGTEQLLAGSDQLAGGAGQLANGANTLTSGLNTLAGKNNELNSGAGQLASGADQISDGSQKLADGSKQIGPALTQVQNGNKTLANKMGDASDKVKKLHATKPTYHQVATPAKASHKEKDHVANNGTGMVPYMFSVAMFVGMMALNLMLDMISPRTKISSLWAWAGSKMAMLFGIAVVAATVLYGLSLAILGMDPINPGATYGFMVLIAVMDAALVTAIYMWFGKAGAFAAMVLLVIQLSGSAGTYPIQLSNKFFEWLHPYLPMTYTVDGLRETVMIGGSIAPQVEVLVGIFVVSIA